MNGEKKKKNKQQQQYAAYKQVNINLKAYNCKLIYIFK